MPHYYECPYCVPSADNRLAYSRMHGSEDKPVYKCKECDNDFLLDKEFQKTQKRKIKDG